MKNSIRLLLLFLVHFGFQKLTQAQAYPDFDCKFSKALWVNDSLGANGFREYFDHAVQCANFDSLFASLNTCADLLGLFGEPDYQRIKKGYVSQMSYYIYMYAPDPNEKQSLIEVLSFRLDSTGAITDLLCSRYGG